MFMFMPMNMHELGMNRVRTVHEVTMIVGMKSMKYGPNFPNFMGAAREINTLCNDNTCSILVVISTFCFNNIFRPFW